MVAVPQGRPDPVVPAQGRSSQRRNRRPKRRELFCPAHPEQPIEGNGKKYFLHLLSAEELQRRGMSAKRAQLVINAYPVLVLSNEWLEELFCPQCGCSRWCHVIKHDRVEHTVRWAPRDLWEQVGHVDPIAANPTVSQFTRREARRHRQKRVDGKRFYD
jgi:hypothetical protein